MSAEIITIAMNKGGVGKTTLINNLAGAISRKQKKKTLLVDLDGQANLSLSFGISPEELDTTVYDVLTNQTPVESAIITLHKYVDILPANSNLSLIEFDILPNFQSYENPFSLLKDALQKVADQYDYIFIDTPPAMGLLVGNALVAANKVVIPYVPELFSVMGLIRINSTIKDFKDNHNPNLEIAGVIAMMVDSRTKLHQDMLKQARAHCAENDIHMFKTVIPRSIKFASSTLKGIPATWFPSRNHLVNSYYDLLKEFSKKGIVK